MTLVLVALLIVAILVTAAAVIDLSVVRQNRQDDKNATDFAAAAGIRSLDNGDGLIQPWKGICAARDFLLGNHDELAGMTSSFFDGEDDPLGVGVDPCAVPPVTTCLDGSPATWGKLIGSADGGRFRVTIQNGYDLTTSGFSEDTNEYSGDTGDGPCTHLAVIVEESEDAVFGGVAGADGYDTTIRSVARLEEDDSGEIAAALILLERHDCEVVDISGINASVLVEGRGLNQGVIHADTLGDGTCTGKIFDVNGSTPPPRIIAGQAEAPDPDTGVEAPGEISTYALTGHPDAEPGNVSDGVDHACARTQASDCGSTTPVTGDSPVERDLVGRAKVDARYREPIIDLRNEAAARFAWTTEAEANDAGFVRVECDAAGPFTDEKIWVDCAGGAFEGNGKTFESTVDEIVINGYITYSGPTPRVLQFDSPSKLFIAGRSGDAISINNSDRIFVNDGGVTDVDGDGFVCDDRYAAAQTARTEMVIGKGELTTNGGVVRLCQTTLFMMDNSSGDCAVPTEDGIAPYDNGCEGTIGGQGTTFYDWTAPNVNNLTTPTEAQLEEFEDLALWSETQSTWSLAGGGGLFLRGIFFTPNADPFKIAGGGNTDVTDAQFISRRLEVAGGGQLVLKPDSVNAITIPVLKGFVLVR